MENQNKIREKESLENLSSYTKEELDSYKYWKWDNYFILVNPSRIEKIGDEYEIYALDTRDGSDFLLDNKEVIDEYKNDRGDFLLGIEK